jgi:hypothetical protein
MSKSGGGPVPHGQETNFIFWTKNYLKLIKLGVSCIVSKIARLAK